MAVGLGIAGLALFFLLPRSIDLIGTGGNLAPTYLEDSGDLEHVIQLTVTVSMEVSTDKINRRLSKSFSGHIERH